jgi:hypothetical protein
MEYTCSLISDIFELYDKGGDNYNLICHLAYSESFLISQVFCIVYYFILTIVSQSLRGSSTCLAQLLYVLFYLVSLLVMAVGNLALFPICAHT